MTGIVMDEINAVRKRNREDYEALARMTSKTIAEIEADTTAPDPGRKEHAPLPCYKEEKMKRQEAIRIVLLREDRYFDRNLEQLRRLLSGDQHYATTAWVEPVVDGRASVCKDVRLLALDEWWFGYTPTASGKELRVRADRVERVTFYLPARRELEADNA